MLQDLRQDIHHLISGVIIGAIAEYYTSYDYNPTKKIAESAKEGAALTITQGLAVGMKSCMLPLIILGITTYVSYAVSGMFGIAMAAVGMLSFVSATVSVDTYGPISDNAGGIAEMSELEPEVREKLLISLIPLVTQLLPSVKALLSVQLHLQHFHLWLVSFMHSSLKVHSLNLTLQIRLFLPVP